MENNCFIASLVMAINKINVGQALYIILQMQINAKLLSFTIIYNHDGMNYWSIRKKENTKYFLIVSKCTTPNQKKLGQYGKRK